VATDRPELHATDGGVMLTVHAQPNARRTEIVGRHGDAVKIRVAAPPTDDRANEALVAFVADVFGVRSGAVTVRSGGSSRHKRLRIDGPDVTTAARILDERMQGLPGA
jgi:uncharacterized protein (TIGR00251 family)